jgi:hypothetical protein
MFAGADSPQTRAIVSARPGSARNILGVQSVVPPSAKALLPTAMLVFLAAAAGARVVASDFRAGVSSCNRKGAFVSEGRFEFASILHEQFKAELKRDGIV